MTEQNKGRETLPIETHIKTLECLGKNIQSMTFNQLLQYAESVRDDSIIHVSNNKLLNKGLCLEYSDEIFSQYRKLQKIIGHAEGAIVYEAMRFCEKLKDIENYIEKKNV